MCICEKGHWTDECRSFPDMKFRKGLLKGKCFICLRTGHTIKDCKIEKPCFHYGQVKNRHCSLCPKKFGKEIWQLSFSTLLSYGQKVIKQTANVKVSNNENRIPTIKTRILMETGSQRTYVTKELKQLQLNPLARESYAVFTFGSSKPKQISNPLVTLDLQLNKGRNLHIKASVVLKISRESLRSRLDKTTIKKLEGYKLADESSKIGVLIGNDHFREILMSGKVKLGLILSGRTNTKQKKNYATTVFTRTTSRIQNQINNNLAMETAFSSDPPIENFWCLETMGITDNLKE